MRKGLLWATSVALVSALPALAQDPKKSDETVKSKEPVVVTKSADKAVLGPATPSETVVAFEAQRERGRGFWVSADYLLWWVKGGPTTTPIVTTSEGFQDAPPGALGQPGTRVLYGDSPIGYGAFSGFRIAAGVEVGQGVYLEGNYFLLARRSNNFSISSDANGSPLIGIAFFNTAIGIQDALLTANPDPNFGVWTGTATVQSSSRLQGWELNLALHQGCNANWSFVPLVGFRNLCLSEDLTIRNQFTPAVNNALTFNGAVVPAGTLLSDQDSFRASNHFYGGQVGGRAEWRRGALTMGLVGKIALGANQEIVSIDGASGMVDAAGNLTTASGGIYAQNSNIGRYYKSTFAVVPEVNLNFGLAVTERLTAKFGYSFLYWSRVARPGNQIDPAIHESQIPTHQFFGLTPSDGRPAFQFRQSDFWAQGINLGLEFVY